MLEDIGSSGVVTLIFSLLLINLVTQTILFFALWRAVSSTKRELFNPPTDQRIARLIAIADANIALLDNAEYRRGLARFAFSEAALLEFLDAAETGFAELDPNQVIDRLTEVDNPEERGSKVRRFLRRKGGKIAETLLGKVNSLLGSFWPGARN